MSCTRWAGLLLVAGLLVAPGAARVAAGNETVIRMAPLAPAGSSWDRVYKAWGNSLSEKTGGAVKFQFVAGSAAGDEAAVVRKLKQGELDAAGLTSRGLGEIASAVSVLQMPGIVADYQQLNEVRAQLAADFDGLFAKQGYKLLGWRDAGFGRVFSKRPILTPDDYKKARSWVPQGDPTLPELLKIVGGNGVPLGIPEVLPALQAGSVDTLVSSAMAAVALQWFRHLDHVSKEAPVAIVGATLVRDELVRSLPPDHQKALSETGKAAHDLLIKQVQQEDNRAYTTLTTKLGLKEFSTQGTPEQKKAWDAASDKLHKNLTGRLWTKELYAKVTSTAAKAKK